MYLFSNDHSMSGGFMDEGRLETNSDSHSRLKMLESVFDNAQVGIIVGDQSEKITYINPEFTRIFGFDINDSKSKNFIKSFPRKRL